MGGGSTFDVQRAKPLASVAAPVLDMHWAEFSRQHVRALNNQFARYTGVHDSWVQTPLKNHPDEIWEDGVRDYLSHALSITDNFSDVVNWIKANNSMGNNLSTAGFENSVSRFSPDPTRSTHLSPWVCHFHMCKEILTSKGLKVNTIIDSLLINCNSLAGAKVSLPTLQVCDKYITFNDNLRLAREFRCILNKYKYPENDDLCLGEKDRLLLMMALRFHP